VRRRLLLSVLSVAAVAVVLLGVPLAVAGAIVRVDVAKAQVQSRAEAVGRLVDEAVTAGRVVDAELIRTRLPDTDEATVSLDSGAVLQVGREPSGGYLSGTYASSTVDVVVRRDRSQVNGDIWRVVGLVATLSVVALTAALLMGLAEARRLTRPMVDLAQTARRLGSGGGRQAIVRYNIEEVDRVAEVLERSSERIADMLAAERQFASDASHQLRTPLTALSMRLEEIASSDDLNAVHEEAKVALTQVERLSLVVDHLLANARHTRSAGAAPIDVDDVVSQQVEEWQPSFSAAGRELQVRGPRGVAALATPAGLSQVLATLLENSLVHGGGTVTVSTRTTGLSVVIEVADEGPGVPPELGARVFERAVSGHSGTGLGLALARDLAEADGGRLELVRQAPAVFALFLSAPEAPSASSSAAASSSSAAGNTHRR
jgi:signal transduction histidine kinase